MKTISGIWEPPKTLLEHLSEQIEKETMSQIVPTKGMKTIHIIEGDVSSCGQKSGFSDSEVKIKTNDGN